MTRIVDDPYDHNQTLVPEVFLAIHSRHGRPLLSRADMEARHELCEDTAVHAAAFLAANGHGAGDAADADEALRRCHAGLVAEPASFAAAEAAWIVRRVAELQAWAQPAWVDVDEPDVSPRSRQSISTPFSKKG